MNYQWQFLSQIGPYNYLRYIAHVETESQSQYALLDAVIVARKGTAVCYLLNTIEDGFFPSLGLVDPHGGQLIDARHLLEPGELIAWHPPLENQRNGIAAGDSPIDFRVWHKDRLSQIAVGLGVRRWYDEDKTQLLRNVNCPQKRLRAPFRMIKKVMDRVTKCN